MLSIAALILTVSFVLCAVSLGFSFSSGFGQSARGRKRRRFVGLVTLFMGYSGMVTGLVLVDLIQGSLSLNTPLAVLLAVFLLPTYKTAVTVKRDLDQTKEDK